MKPSTHILVGAAVGSFIGSASGTNLLELLAIGAVAGMTPDVDSVLRIRGRNARRTPVAHSILGASVTTFVWVMVYLFVRLDPGGPFETVPALESSLVVFLASFLHAVLDAFTVDGCRLWYPLSDRIVTGTVAVDDIRANTVFSLVSIGVILLALLVDIHSVISS